MLANPLFCNASTSRPKTLIPLASVASLHRLQPRFTEMEALCDAIESTGLYPFARVTAAGLARSEEHTSELQSLMRISYAVFCLKKKRIKTKIKNYNDNKTKDKR